jgi:glutathione S-transferase
MSGSTNIGHVALACALGWVDYRMTGMSWRGGRPKLAKWYDTISRRPSMVATAPPPPKP